MDNTLKDVKELTKAAFIQNHIRLRRDELEANKNQSNSIIHLHARTLGHSYGTNVAEIALEELNTRLKQDHTIHTTSDIHNAILQAQAQLNRIAWNAALNHNPNTPFNQGYRTAIREAQSDLTFIRHQLLKEEI